MITVEDFLFMEDKHKLSDYPDEESVDKVRSDANHSSWL